ncbi:dihydropteroate synthase [Pseudoclavibacter sp. VKM Ac-2867]|uniref:dihydropteroate synthase n=1 Tax=Pseudoclavibacter sp. VKM Ac-2867 TaxID=2783829 RepID=UPI00188CFB74|nr:dihydropteroate synthase [Pseudoclavibacter sp. VKM Ac-2867]MBF4457308.1 dihydropteroate synthase [Pseudoclavibacter sp. VKM Ac-2867]
MNDIDSGSVGRIDLVRAQAAVREFLSAIGEDPDRPGLERTPVRVAEAALELFGGVGVDASAPLASARFPVAEIESPFEEDAGVAGPGGVSQPVVLRDLAFRSVCEHHLLPFSGRVHLAYVPSASIVGFGRLHRMLETLSARPTLQERLGDELVDVMMSALDARGALAVIEASHACAGLRGSRQQAGTVVTVSARGELSEPVARAEIMSLIGSHSQVPVIVASEVPAGAAGSDQPVVVQGHVLRGARFDPVRGSFSTAGEDDVPLLVGQDASGPEQSLAFEASAAEAQAGADVPVAGASPEADDAAAVADAVASSVPSAGAAPTAQPRARFDPTPGDAEEADDTGPVTTNTRPFALPQRFTNLLQPAIPKRPRILGILNITPDSFSDGGRFEDLFSEKRRTKRAMRRARELVDQGADIIDVGGESTRPGAVRVPQEEEAARVLPVVKELAALGVLVSIDTMYAKTAAAALALGAEYVNDVSGGLADPAMLEVVAESRSPFILSHWRGHSVRMNELADYRDPAAEILAELAGARDRAVAAGLDESQIVLDPGLGFAKRRDDNWAVLRELEQFVALGHPLLVGASRKRFTGEMLRSDAQVTERDLPTAVITALAAKAGIWGVRVHNVEANRVALDVVASWREGAQDD